MQRSIATGIGAAALIVVLLTLQLTTPRDVGLFGILVFFILIYVVCLAASYVVLVSLSKILLRVLTQGKWRLAMENMTVTRAYYYSSILALAPVILVGMHSVGSVGATDLVLLLVFEVLGCFYISRRF